MTTFRAVMFASALVLCSPGLRAAESLLADAEQALEQGVAFYRSIAIHGGYPDRYSADLTRIGDTWAPLAGRTPRDLHIDIDQTALIGSACLRAHFATGKKGYLRVAGEVADTLVKAQNPLGGWVGRAYFDGRVPQPFCELWDPPTRDALLFLMAYDGVERRSAVQQAVKKGLAFMMKSQFENGAWPPEYPLEAKYPNGFPAPYFFNDGTTNECLNLVIEAHRRYRDPDLLKAARKAGDFICIAQLPPPQSGWAQQYNRYLQPSWHREFEPASVCSLESVGILHSLIALYLHTGAQRYIDPIPDALRWLRESRLANGRWARYYELGTNKPLYYDWGRKRVSSISELSRERQIGYRYELNLDVEGLEAVYRKILELGREAYLKERDRPLTQEERTRRLQELEPRVRRIIVAQKDGGKWVTIDKDKYLPPGKTKWVEWNGERKKQEILSSTVFRANVLALSEFIDLARLSR